MIALLDDPELRDKVPAFLGAYALEGGPTVEALPIYHEATVLVDHLRRLNINTAQSELDEWHCEIIRENLPGGNLGEALYHWYFHKNGGIFIVNIDRTKDSSPKPKDWFEILWKRWTLFCTQNSVPALCLKYIYVYWITNSDTRPVISRLGSMNAPEGAWKRYLPPSDGFMALLRTPNGNFLTRLLPNHGNDLQRRPVKSVELLRHSDFDPVLCWELEDIDPNYKPPKKKGTPSKSRANRLKSRESGSSNVETP